MVLYCYEFVRLVLLFFYYIHVKFVIWFHRLPSRHLFGKELLTRFACFVWLWVFLCCTSFPSDIVGGVRNLILTVPDTCLF